MSPNWKGETFRVRAATTGTARIVIWDPKPLIVWPVQSFRKSGWRSSLGAGAAGLADTALLGASQPASGKCRRSGNREV
jgi:hypothetical protein